MDLPTANEALTEALVPNRDFPIRLPVFEGPLDLLLFLIRRNEVDIYDIPIESVTRQYLEVLHTMDKMNLEVAGDFFVMAATLMYIKSRMLLPTNEQAASGEEEEEEADPRWELVQQLIEYKRFKEASAEIRRLLEQQHDYLPRIYKARDDTREARPLQPSDKIELWNIFNLVLRRLAEKISHGEIHDDQITVADRMESILNLIAQRESFQFSELFTGRSYNLAYLVASFLAILELTRLKKITLRQDVLFEDIECVRRQDADEPDGQNEADGPDETTLSES